MTCRTPGPRTTSPLEELLSHEGVPEELKAMIHKAVREEHTANRQMIEALHTREEQFRTLVENVNTGVYRNTGGPKGRFLNANPAIARMFGYDSVEEFLQVQVADLYEDSAERAAFVEEALGKDYARNKELRLKRRDGTLFWGSVTAQVIHNPDGSIKWFDGIIEDITERKKAEHALQLTQFSLDRAVIPTLWITRQGRLRYVNEAACEVLGYSKDELLKVTVDDIDPSFSPELRAAHWEEIKRIGAVTFETWCLRKDASAFPAEIRTNYLAFGGEEYEVAFLLDLTERKRLEEELRALSRQDGLTELPNRRAFEEQLDQEWRRAIRADSPLSLLMVDIDHFKQYNDTLGHLAGDQCLRQVANLLREAFLRATDLPCRWGGEEFAVILAETDSEDALTAAERLCRRVEEAGLSREPLPGVVTLSVGVATIRHPTDLTLSDLKVAADEALYASKNTGRNRVTAAGVE